MGSDAPTLHPLAGQQADAVLPDRNVWLSASAGTGKTQVLSARVFRLLLRENVDPEHILCLTFTKAGAAEMANRIHRQLAAWVRMKDTELAADLRAIGAPTDPETRKRARTLFAKVLDARGGGLRIMTIHSFCQALLASFPEEAGIGAMFKPIEERDQKILAREALSDLLLEEEAQGRPEVIAAVQALSVRMGEEGAEKFLMQCASKPEAMEALPQLVLPHVRFLLQLPVEADADDWLAAQCEDSAIDRAGIEQFAGALQSFGGAAEKKRADILFDWLAAEPSIRGDRLEEIHYIWALKKGGSPRNPTKNLERNFPEYFDVAERLISWSQGLLERRILFAFSDLLAASLHAGRAFYHRYATAKRLHGVVDFDDMIRMTATLLQRSQMSAWIRYKLDQRTDHILVDEAQDTNLAQWDIVQALSDEFFAGQGAYPERLRTLFTVGDFKQAIFGFQGTSPHNYMKAGKLFAKAARDSGRAFEDMSLDLSFRSTPAILEVVDSTLEQLSHDQLGMETPIPAHQSHHAGMPGCVHLLKPVAHGELADPDDEESWIDDEKRLFATKLARQLKRWLSPEQPLWLAGKGRVLEPGDIMILVSKRDELSNLIVARLAAEGVAVAGIDRIHLDQPLAVQDLLACIRFVLQPQDDLNLASLLVSPLIGWSQDQLLEHGYRDAANERLSLWDHIRSQGSLVHSIAPLAELLRMADFNTPYQFLETILSGEMTGREKLVSRLGHSALDPMEELLNTALLYERDHVPTLQGFLDWFDRGDVEIKREAGESGNEVRLMTVHGAKGLQAPMVILADATFNPDNKRGNELEIPDPVRGDSAIAFPSIPVRTGERVGLLKAYATIADQRQRQEHWRLLYVAMTRAEEQLVVCGTLGARAKGAVPEESWFKAVENGLMALESELVADPDWISLRRYEGEHRVESNVTRSRPKKKERCDQQSDLPGWAREVAPEEARPPRPLAPSALSTDDASSPPLTIADRSAAERGKILHSLFQRLPDIGADERANAADSWLHKQKGITDRVVREEIIKTVLSVIERPEWSNLFEPTAFAEAPIAAVVGEVVISGTVDRLLVTDDEILVVDFKTGRKVPETAEEAPVAYLRQMAAYAAALSKIFPGREIRAALLYSHSPRMLKIDQQLLDLHKPGLERP